MSGGSKIPKGWVETTLGETGKVITGKTPSKNNPEDWGELIDFITPTEIGNEKKYIFNTPRKLSKLGHERFSRMILPINSIIVTCIGSDMGKVVLNKNKALTNQQINSIIVNSDNHFDYIYYLLKNAHKVLRRIADGSGSTMPILNKSNFETLSFIIPDSKAEQQAIASILTTFDDKIELLQAQNQTLEATAQTIFKEWFGKYQIGDELPEGWKVGILGDVIKKINTGADAIQKAPIVDYDTGIKCLRIGDLSNNRPIDQWGYSKVTDKNFKQFQLRKYDILVTRTSILGLNKLVMEDLNAVYNNGLIRFSLIEKVNPFYIYGYFRSKYYENYISMINNDSSTRPNMKIDYLLKFPILLPPKELETKFSNIMESVLSKVSYNTQQIQTLQQTRDTLLPKLMSGKVRVDEFRE